jgi:hypothetical protein
MRIQRMRALWLAVGAGIFSTSAIGQEKPSVPTAPTRAADYDVKRESVLLGRVVAYAQVSVGGAQGPHVTLETSAGVVDVHLGDARLLAANHFQIQAGDTLRVIGENVANGGGGQFLARILQKGTQVLEVRSVRGFPLSYAAPRDGTKPQGGVL